MSILLTTGRATLSAWSALAHPQEDPPVVGSGTTESSVVSPTPEGDPEDAPVPPPAAAAVTQADVFRRARPQPAFTVTWTRTATSPDGQSRLRVSSTRHQRSDRTFKLVHTFYEKDGAAAGKQTYFGLMGLGYFRTDEASRTLIFTTPVGGDEPEDLEEYLRAQPEFDREEDVLGQRTIVWRTAEAGGTGYVEEYRALALGGLLLKRVADTPRGREVFEPTEITLDEPASGLFAELSGYEVEYSYFERRIQEMGRRGNKEAAHAMRQELRRMRAAKSDGR